MSSGGDPGGVVKAVAGGVLEVEGVSSECQRRAAIALPTFALIGGTGRGRGRGRGLTGLYASSLRNVDTTSKNLEEDISPKPLYDGTSASATGDQGQFSDAEVELTRTYYTAGEFSKFTPQPVTYNGDKHGQFYQSIQKYTEHQRYVVGKRFIDPQALKTYTDSERRKVDCELDKDYITPPDDFVAPNILPVPLEKQGPFVQEVVIDHVKGVNDFVIKPKNNIQLGILCHKLNNWYKAYKAMYPSPELYSLVTGGHYVAFVRPENFWLRVALRDWTDDGDVILESLDFGGLISTTVDQMRYLRKVFCTVPMQAISAKLQTVKMPTSQGGREWTWKKEEEAFFKVDVQGKFFSATIITDEIERKTSRRICGVILFQVKDGKISPYTFGGRLQYGYKYGTNVEPLNNCIKS